VWLDLGRLPHEKLPQRLNRRESLRRSTAVPPRLTVLMTRFDRKRWRRAWRLPDRVERKSG
jgi:hypothetical protein